MSNRLKINRNYAAIQYQRGMYKRLGYKKTRVRQIIKARAQEFGKW